MTDELSIDELNEDERAMVELVKDFVPPAQVAR